MIAGPLRRCLAPILVFSGLFAGAPAQAGNTEALLAASWQPAFCEDHGRTPECRRQTAGRFDSSHFSLHGLWPLKREYCGVDAATYRQDQSGDWLSLPALDLKPETRKALARVMPGTRSGLHRHEWYKHGTCTGLTPEDYFSQAIKLLNVLNGSEVALLFAENIGSYLSAGAIKQAFVAAFGKGADRRVKMKCTRDRDRELIAEITIGLSADYARTTALEPLIQGAGTTSFGCRGGIVDPAGFQ